eukprot:TRINITY_DN1393_c0_g1_i4.p1 TRINITY_DN1393_c0_g1~~TRINITY_DN1393_c0_g1_i4.p1  ORF type:complete len:100 (+),score=1.59 TRINITY_DN1393_c0_g1_i4:193-492(+)
MNGMPQLKCPPTQVGAYLETRETSGFWEGSQGLTVLLSYGQCATRLLKAATCHNDALHTSGPGSRKYSTQVWRVYTLPMIDALEHIVCQICSNFDYSYC